MQKPIGIFGGTFDPIHLGHLHLANTVRENCDLQKILLIPCAQSPLRPKPLASATDRYNMVKLAIQHSPHLAADDREIKQNSPSYTFNILQSLCKEFAGTSLCLIMGRDAFCDFNKWHRWREIIQLAHIIVADRPNAAKPIPPDLITLLKKHQIFASQKLRNSCSGHIYFTQINPLSISGTQIRKLIHSGKDANDFVTKEVWDYILKYRLYS